MASDRGDLHASAGDRRVKLRYSYGGKILPRLSDGALRYVGGETRILTVHRDTSLAEILRRMGEVCGGTVVLRYQLPDEDLDALISVSTSEDLENMMEEYDKMVADNTNAKLRVFLFSPSDVSGSGAGPPLAPYHDLQDTGARYLEAVNGLDSSIRRRDSGTSFSSTQNSDGLMAVEALANEGQDVPGLLPTTDYNDQTQILSSSQYELPPMLPNQSKFFNSVQPELLSAPPTVPRRYIEQRHDYPQPFLGRGTPPINVVVAPDACMPPEQIDTTTAHAGNGMTRVDFQTDLNTGRVVRIPGDTKLQPLSKLPPLPPPHFLAPNMERRPVPASSQGLTIKFVDCSLCQKALPHVHSDTLINEQGIGHGYAIPATNMLLQSHYSEDLAKRVPLQTADSGADIQAKNLAVLAPRNHEFFERAPAMSHINVRPSVNSANLDHAKTSEPPVSVGLSAALQPSNGTESTPEKSHKEGSVLKQQPLPINRDHSNIVLTPASLSAPHNTYGSLLTPQSHREDSLQQQMHLPQKIGFHNYPFNPSFIHKSFVTDVNLGANPDVLALYSHVRPMDSMNPPRAPGFSDHPRPTVVLADIGISKGLNSEQPPFVVASSHNIGPQDRGSELSFSNPPIASGVVPEGNSSLLSSQLPSVMRDVAHLQSVQLSNNIHSPYITGNHELYLYHHEAGAGPRGMFNYADPINDNQACNKNLSDKNNEIPSVHPVEVFSNGFIPQTDSAQLLRNMNQMQQVVSSDPLVSNMDPQKLLDSTILPPGASNVSSATKDFCNRNYPVNNIGSELTVPVAVSVQTPNSLNMDAPKELPHPLKDLGDAQIKEDNQNTEGNTSTLAVTLQSSELPVPAFNSRETKETIHGPFREHTTIEDTTVTDEKKETKTKQLGKAKNGFPNTDEIGNLQVIKNNDLEELQELGSGSFGTVYHGKWRGTDVAIKRINDRVFSGNSSEQDRAVCF
ncbi:uncharacterized protein LOC121984680 isoform X3 [Zingiber officinale]|uniref:uncharacterized protein LOC121984680 isoform X2 n=1 Tax=Zingiber officinale TaxID=94328 RepID=UPI001C4C3EDB|nr:uncharacterized protein LOC121984680 isoform X2 [Zingiber officinale]XP_042393689.1 uncharacterized protein LOC121984680 isoform X3 [Zingiber officinale]